MTLLLALLNDLFIDLSHIFINKFKIFNDNITKN